MDLYRNRSVSQIPTAAHNSFYHQDFDVLSMPTAGVEEGHALTGQAVAQEALDWAGEIPPLDRRFVPVNGGVFHTLVTPLSDRYILLWKKIR